MPRGKRPANRPADEQNSRRSAEQAGSRAVEQSSRGSASGPAGQVDGRHRRSRPADRELVHSQNFLTSRRLVEQLVRRAEIGPDDLVLEVGPGRGIITVALAKRARRVVAVEKDATLAARLTRRFVGNPAVNIVQADFLDVALPRAPFKVFASLPFNATSEIVMRLLGAAVPPDELHLVVQREAAERYLGRPRESLVAVLHKPWFEPAVVHRFERHDFSPAPRVDVVMLRLRKRGPPRIGDGDARLFRDFVSYGFTAWRPSLASALEALIGRPRTLQVAREVGLPLEAPPGLVRFELWLRLFEALRDGDRALLSRRLAGAEQRLRLQQQRLAKIHRTPTRWTRRPPPNRLIA